FRKKEVPCRCREHRSPRGEVRFGARTIRTEIRNFLKPPAIRLRCPRLCTNSTIGLVYGGPLKARPGTCWCPIDTLDSSSDSDSVLVFHRSKRDELLTKTLQRWSQSCVGPS